LISTDGTTASIDGDFFSGIFKQIVSVRLTAGKSLLGARNGPLVFNVDEILDDGNGISISGKLAFGAVIV